MTDPNALDADIRAAVRKAPLFVMINSREDGQFEASANIKGVNSFSVHVGKDPIECIAKAIKSHVFVHVPVEANPYSDFEDIL